jgi:hypothetical protein
MSKAQLSGIERGDRPLPPKRYTAIAKALKVDRKDIVALRLKELLGGKLGEL